MTVVVDAGGAGDGRLDVPGGDEPHVPRAGEAVGNRPRRTQHSARTRPWPPLL